MPASLPPVAPHPVIAARAGETDGPCEGHDSHDPFERQNRALYELNAAIDAHVLRPVAVGYRHIAPRFLRQGLHNLLSNLGEPSIFINDALQLHPARAVETAARFAINSTFGALGLFDVASGAGLPGHENDFGLTLGRYGLDAGPYLYLPVFGPSSVRDTLGQAVDFVLDPIPPSSIRDQTTFVATQMTLDAVDGRLEADGDLKAIQATSFDPYASMRSIYRQYRQGELNGGHASLDNMPDMDDAPQPPTAPQTDPTATPRS